MMRSRKGITDPVIAMFILILFFGTAIIIPFINDSFNVALSEPDTDLFEQNIKDDADSVSTIDTLTVFLNVLKLALFDFENTLGLPFWLDAIYTVLAIMFIFVIARTIRGN